MTILNDIMHCEYLIPLAVIIALILPLVPNKKLRYYACYINYATILSLTGMMILPWALLHPRNIGNLKLASNIVKHSTKILGIKWTLRGEEILKKDRTAIIVANHQSILDILGMTNIWDAMDKCTVIAKKELLYYVPFGPLVWLAGLVFVDRTSPKTATNKIEATVHDLCSKKAKLWIFPEGTRNKNGKFLLPFKKGAFRVAICAQVPILPIVYSPYYFIDSVKKTFSEGKIIISALEPISTEGLTLDDVDSLKEKTYKLMSDEYEKLQIEIKSLHK